MIWIFPDRVLSTLYDIPYEGKLRESYFRTSSSSEVVKNSKDFYDMDPGGA